MAGAVRASVCVDAFASGLLARLGHDVRLELGRFELELSAGELHGRFGLESLRVAGTLHGERCDASAPSAADRAQIERAVREDILRAARFGDAMLTARASAGESGLRVSGELTLCGQRAPIELRALRSDGALEAQATLVPSRFGIAPYRALGGALKVADEVVVRVRLPFDMPIASEAELLQASARWSSP